MVFIYPNTMSTFSGDDGIALESGYVKIEESVYQDLVDRKKIWENGKIVSNPNYASEQAEKELEQAKEEIRKTIGQYKQFLEETDYKAIKFSEGEITAEEYEPTKLLRRQWREKINELERS